MCILLLVLGYLGIGILLGVLEYTLSVLSKVGDTRELDAYYDYTVLIFFWPTLFVVLIHKHCPQEWKDIKIKTKKKEDTQ